MYRHAAHRGAATVGAGRVGTAMVHRVTHLDACWHLIEDKPADTLAYGKIGRAHV